MTHLEMRASTEDRTGVEFVFRTPDRAELVAFAPDPKDYDISITFRTWLRDSKTHVEIHSVTVSERGEKQ